ncbi:L-idonate 5-dehydrogenase [Micropruina sp.]|uniref:L-idonate 5-dehydrogenase n=1 Tax=Micropruina sp. TaxID=2737536 RepID=UPI0039E28F26
MKTLKIHGAENITIEDAPVPEPGDGEVRVRMQYGGICGSDLHYYFHGRNGAFVVTEPFTPGHEMSGVIDLDPSGRWAAGTRVTIAPATYGTPQPGIENRKYLWPGGSYFGSASTTPHTQGGMSQYRLVPAFMVRELPEGLSTRDAALAEPLAVALHAISIAGGVEGQKVLVTGSGPIGLCVVAAAAALNAAEVTATDMLEGPLERARAVGATTTLKAGVDEVPPLAYDVVFECSGVAPAVNQALGAVRRAGTVVQVGILPADKIAVNLEPLVSREVRYLGTFRFDNEIDQAIAMLADYPQIAKVITHVIDADRIVEAFETARNSQESGKVVVSLWLDDEV